ncbi:maleylacetoacetate isomerase [Croceibacterium sp. TMG7-5b_MA50]|uniref:maleylacetoacetate isomerase n=1 Tax=Croceibacterium sp. TMG7-5b_MA50 TaxID=3121290 RepID=UPI003221F5D6
MNGGGLILHDYWRSSAAFRVRIALNLKGIAYTSVPHDLRTGAQGAPEYRALAPHALVPALEHDGGTIIESLAIIEWLEARWPTPALLPHEPDAAAHVRAMALLVACDIHPLNNLRVVEALREDFGASCTEIARWMAHWMDEGFAALEVLVARGGGRFCHGDTPTLADCCLIPQLANARRFCVDLAPYPRLVAVETTALEHPAFAAAHPSRQVGAEV